MSRSIGDIYLKRPEFNRDPLFQQFGLAVPLERPVMSAEPSILIRKLRPQDLFLIFASDGLWEQLSDEVAVDIVMKNPRVVSPPPRLSFSLFISPLLRYRLPCERQRTNTSRTIMWVSTVCVAPGFFGLLPRHHGLIMVCCFFRFHFIGNSKAID